MPARPPQAAVLTDSEVLNNHARAVVCGGLHLTMRASAGSEAAAHWFKGAEKITLGPAACGVYAKSGPPLREATARRLRWS